jgi:hypothetical protein
MASKMDADSTPRAAISEGAMFGTIRLGPGEIRRKVGIVPGRGSGMLGAMSQTETELWKGTSSQVKNFWWFVACLLVIPIPWAIWAWLKVKCRVYTLTTERLLIADGVLNKSQETLELYRVRDQQVTEPFILRLFGLQNIHLLATDLTTESVVLDYIPKTAGLPDLLRKHVEECRMRKRVREVGIDLDPGVGDVTP